ncbi:MAG: DUF2905 domain-containing protein [Clostridiaceae bacterium]|nr:DUF2905 domain-containing protein [Clostridiaceae bacterium]
MLQSLGKHMIVFGIILAIIGVVLLLGGKIGLGKLPGDIVIRRKSFTLYFPLITCIIISIVLTLVLNLISRFRK